MVGRPSRIALAGFCALALTTIPPLVAKEETGRAEIAELEAKVGTMYVVGRLKLTEAQKQALLAARKTIAPAAAEYLRRRQAWRKNTAQAVEGFVEYSTRTGEFPPDSIQDGLWKYDGEWQAMPRDFRNAARPATDAFCKTVTAQQAEVLKQSADPRKVIGAEYLFPDSAEETETDSEASEADRAAAIAQRMKVATLSRPGYLCTAPYLEEALGVTNPDFPHWWDMTEEIVQSDRIGVTLTLTFLTGINLDEEQLRTIAKCMRKNLPATGQVGAYGEDVETSEARKYAKLLRGAVKNVERGRSFSPQDMSTLLQARGAWRTAQGKCDSPSGLAKRQKAITAIRETVSETLTQAQIARMLGTNDCPIPSQAVKGISRAGQVAADQLAKACRVIDSARQREDWETPSGQNWWKQQVAQLCGGKGLFGKMTDEEKRAAYALATDVAEQARGMSATDYVAKREKLCKDLPSLELAKGVFLTIQKGTETEEGRQKLLQGKVNWFFVCYGSVVLPLIEARLQHMGTDGKAP